MASELPFLSALRAASIFSINSELRHTTDRSLTQAVAVIEGDGERTIAFMLSLWLATVESRVLARQDWPCNLIPAGSFISLKFLHCVNGGSGWEDGFLILLLAPHSLCLQLAETPGVSYEETDYLRRADRWVAGERRQSLENHCYKKSSKAKHCSLSNEFFPVTE